MKKSFKPYFLIPIIISIIITVNVSAQSEHICNYSTESVNQRIDKCIFDKRSSLLDKSLTNLVEEILGTVGIKTSNFLVMNCSYIYNALAFNDNNNRYILIDDNFFLDETKSDYARVLILSHEIGHHLHGHTVIRSHNESEAKHQELEADRFSGYVMGKLNIGKKKVLSIVETIFDDLPSISHPTKRLRIESILQGYEDAFENDMKIINEYYKILVKAVYEDIAKNNLLIAKKEREELIRNFSPTQLDRTINAYLNIQYIKNDLLSIELAEMYALRNDYASAHALLSTTYENMKETESAINLGVMMWHYSYKGDLTLVKDYNSIMKNIEYKNLLDPTVLKYYAKYYLIRGDYFKGKEILKFTVDKFYQPNTSNDDSKYLFSDIYNDLAIIELRNEEDEKAYDYIKKSISIRNSIPENLKTEDLINFQVDVNNYETLLYNLALIQLRRDMNNQVIEICDSLERMSPETVYVSNGELDYFKGQALFQLKEYNQASLYFSHSIKKDPTSTFNYYFRGLCRYYLNDYNKSCTDLTIACDGGINEACSKLKLLCDD